MSVPFVWLKPELLIETLESQLEATGNWKDMEKFADILLTTDERRDILLKRLNDINNMNYMMVKPIKRNTTNL